MTDEDGEKTVSSRGLVVKTKKFRRIGEEIKAIRNTGFSATVNRSDRDVFEGMFLSIDELCRDFISVFEDAAEYCVVHEIEAGFPTKADQEYFEAVKKCFYEAKGYHVKIHASTTRSSLAIGDASMLNATTSAQARTILPRIVIKPFDGKLSEWTAFKQVFESLVIGDNNLTDAERFHYLTSYVLGSAYDTIRHIQVSEANFTQAWTVLNQVYDDKRKLAVSYLDKFLNFKPASGKPSCNSLQNYLASVTESITALKNLKIPDFSEYLLCELALRSLDPVTREGFETHIIGTTFPKFTDLQSYVRNRCQVLRLTQQDTSAESSDQSKPQPTPPHSRPPRHPNKYAPQNASDSHSALLAQQDSEKKSNTSSKLTCFICKGPHRILECEEFLKATPPQRLDLLRTWNGCRSCMHPYHRTNQCKSKHTCRECSRRHHTLLHLPTTNAGTNQNTGETAAQPPHGSNTPPSSGFTGANVAGRKGVLLGTVCAKIRGADGNLHVFRGVLDAGSQFSFLTESTVKSLGRTTRPLKTNITGVNQTPLKNISGQIDVSFISISGHKSLSTEVVIVPSITPPLPQTKLDDNMWLDYQSYDLSDPEFTTPGPIQFLIGADLYPDVVIGAPIILHERGPRLISTVFGYTVIGQFTCNHPSPESVSLMAVSEMAPLIERFWTSEEIPSDGNRLSPEETQCEEHFINTHRRTEDGRYIISLPFKTPAPQLQPDQEKVIGRLRSLETKLAKNPELSKQYHKFMADYQSLGHMSPATSPPSYLLPHHPVLKTDAAGNGKLRVVFDASFRTSTGSLNDHLLTGPKLHANIPDIVLQLRRFRYVVTCDIVKCFRQILVEPSDRKYQQIVWRSNPEDPVQYYQLDTLPYGLRSSPYLSNRVLAQLAIDEGEAYPLAAKVLRHHTYVDDLAYGSDTVDGLVELKSQLINLLAKGGFPLDKWSSNYPPLLAEMNPTAQQPVDLKDSDEHYTKILGMQWNPSSDVFSYQVSPPQDAGSTKREIMSAIARLFDPLGYLAPVIFFAKRILQETWISKVGWDENVPELILNSWHQFTSELGCLADIKISRPFPKTDSSYQLICFSDASEKGYCATAYLRSTQGNSADMTLLMAKTRLAPLDTLTIPRLELNGALLLANLIKSLERIRTELGIEQVYCFTDSTIVLSWIRTPTYLLQTYVASRVRKILELTKIENWYHVKGKENPADLGSRGLAPSLLQGQDLWWNGPKWSCSSIDTWPISAEVTGIEVPELKPIALSLVSVKRASDIVEYTERHSSLLHLVRVIAWIKRFKFNSTVKSREKDLRKRGPLSAQEFSAANRHLIRLLQHHYYPEAFAKTKFDEMPLELRRLDPFIDAEGLLRVGGRLGNAPLTESQRHPILLPKRSHFTNLIVDHYHRKTHHIGPNALLAMIRQEYWIPAARNLVRFVKHRCVVCTRFSKQTLTPFMGNLPVARFSAVRPFLQCGCDFAGPFICRESHLRKSRVFKSYLCVFVCLSTRAVHLELATGLSVEDFLDSFDRFVARRGIPAVMYSDCGTNFIGASGYLKEIVEWYNQESVRISIANHTSHLSIQWKFNPPLSPHFGGGWEAAVKSSKDLIYKSFGNRPYTSWELSTMFTKVEGLLNSRPLQPVSDSPDDLATLTPGHFLIGQPLNAIPEPDFTDVPENRLKRWELIRERVQHFWSRWKEEYITSLQPREKWTKKLPNLQVGDLVLLSDVNTPPTKWPMARILEVHPGQDQVVRVVTLRTSRGTYKRPVTKLVPLHL